MEISNLLQKIGFSTSLIQQIVQFGNVKTFSTGTKVFHEKSYSPAVPLVLKGTLKITSPNPTVENYCCIMYRLAKAA